MKLKLLLWMFALIVLSSFVLPNPIMCYDFEDDTDAMGNYNLTSTGETIVGGKIGNCFDLEGGENDLVDFNFAPVTLGNDYAICGWWKQEDAGHMGLVYSLDVAETGNAVGLMNWDGMNFQMKVGDDGQYQTGTNMPNGVWIHYCMVRYDNDNASLFINGTFKGSIVTGVGYNYEADNFITRGAADVSRDFDGLIDNVHVWNRSLTSTEVLADYNSFTGVDCSSFKVDTTPPTNSSWNVTSAVVSGQERNCWNDAGGCEINITGDNLSFTFTANENSNWSCRMDVEQNYSQMVTNNSNYKLATTETTSHAGTLYDNITLGNHCLYCSGVDSLGNEPASGVSSSGCLNFTLVENITIMITSITPLNGTDKDVGNFNTSNLEEIGKMEINFTITSDFSDLSFWSFNFTANGTGSCSLGNLQDDFCYNYTNSNSSRIWIEYINGTITSTFDGTEFGRTIDDGITSIVTKSLNNREWNVSLVLVEHYNPNVFKHYGSLYNFSDVKWQDGVNQRITQDNILKLHIGTDEHIAPPLDADQYRLDIRVNHSTGANTPTQPLHAFICNDNYTQTFNGSPHDAPSDMCALVGAKLPAELQDDGTKYRIIFTKHLVDELGNIEWAVLDSDSGNPNRYYYIKTYKATALGYTPHWEYSTDDGTTWAGVGDGYETEVNINWFYGGTDPTAFIGKIFANTTQGTSSTNLFNQTWTIDPSQKYNPIVSLVLPEVGQAVGCPFNVTWLVDDPNDDNLNVSLFLFSGSSLNQTIITNMNQSNTSYYWNCTDVYGYWFNLTIEAKKIVDERYNSSDTHQIIVYDCTYECTLFDSCEPNSTGGYKDCLTVNETEICKYIGDYSEFRESCNYCNEDINLYSTETENEFCDDYTLLQNMTFYYVDDNYYTCCNVTNASSDCNIRNETLYFNYTQLVDCSTIDCLYDSSPYLKFFDKKIPLICVVNKNASYHFLVYVKADNQTIQTNPKRELIEDYGEYNSFKSENGLVNLYYTSTNLRPDRNVTVIIEGQNGIFYNEFVAVPTYKDPYQLQDRLFWTWDNAGTIIGGIFIFLILGIFVIFLVRYAINSWS